MSFLPNVVLLMSTLVVLATVSLTQSRRDSATNSATTSHAISFLYTHSTPSSHNPSSPSPDLNCAGPGIPSRRLLVFLRAQVSPLPLSPHLRASSFSPIKRLCCGHVPCGRASSIHGCLPCVLPLFSSVDGAVWPSPTSPGVASRRGCARARRGSQLA
jgi:hypothetical protein